MKPGSIRKLCFSDRDELRDHLLRLDDRGRRYRFGIPVNSHYLKQHAERAFRAGSVLHGYFTGGTLRAVAELQPGDGGSAEAAFSVETAFQRAGIGSALLLRTLLVAGNRGIERVTVRFLADNRPMRALAAKFRATAHARAEQVCAEISTRPPTPLSLWREGALDAAGMASAMFDVQVRLLRAA